MANLKLVDVEPRKVWDPSKTTDDGIRLHWFRKDTGVQVCARYSEARDTVCARHDVDKVTGRCRLHDGRASSTLPVSAKHAKDARSRYARFLAGDLAAELEASYSGIADLDQTQPIAILDLAVKRSAERVGERDTPAFRRRAVKLFDQARDAQTEGDVDGFASNINELGRLLRRGVSENAAFSELKGDAETLNKALGVAWQTKLAQGRAVSRTEVGILFGHMAQVIQQTLLEEMGKEKGAEIAAVVFDRLDSMVDPHAIKVRGNTQEVPVVHKPPRGVEF